MYISSLIIRNFRNFGNATFKFRKGVNTVIGENGSGKTNAFYALRMLLDSNLPRYALNLRESDFNRSLDTDWKGHWIVISINLEELSYDEIIQCLAVHEAGIADGSQKGNYNFYFRPKSHIRKKLYDLSISDARDEEEIQHAIDEILISDYEPVITVGAPDINFNCDEFYKKNIGDFENLIFPNPDEEPINELGQYNRLLNIYNEISCTFAEALRNVVADLKSYRNNPLITLLTSKENEIEDEDKEQIHTTIQGLNDRITGLPSVKKVSKGILNTVRETVGDTYAPFVDLEANLPNEISGLLRSLVLKVGDGDDPDYKGRIEELSLGGANLIYLSLKILEYHLELKKDKAAHFLLIEEPEAHIHTHIQKTLFEKINLDKTQIIYSTHSTHVSEVSAIESVNILSKDVKKANVYHPSNGLNPDEIKRIERYLDATRSTLLFAKSVMLVEGDAELILIPNIIKKVYGVSIDELGISLINVGSTSFTNIVNIFHEDRVQKKCAIITDNDLSIIDLPDDPKNDTLEQKSYRDAQKNGKERKVKLDQYGRNSDLSPLIFLGYRKNGREIAL